MNGRATARRLLERAGGHPIISLYMNLDPERFATGAARATQARSLIDEAGRARHAETELGHEDRVALDRDLERLQRFLTSGEAPVSGARALAVFCSGQDDLFEAVQLSEPTEPRAVIARTPYVEPLATGPEHGSWCVALVNRREARIFDGQPAEVDEREQVSDDVHGQHRQGGFSQANYERSYEQEVDDHLRHVAEQLHTRWRRHPFATLVLGGPAEVVSRFEDALHGDLRPLVVSRRIELDVATATRDQVRGALAPLLAERESERRRHALEELSARLGSGGAAAAGAAEVLRALAERRVEALLLSPSFDGGGARCPACGLLSERRGGRCPADGTELEAVADLREATIEAALLQDAELVVGEEEDPAGQGIAALLRF